MDREKPAEPIQPGHPSDMINVMVTLERPPSKELANYNRGQKYAFLRENATRIRERLVEWIQEQGLSEEVARVGEATVFNALFVTCTPGAAELLTQAPGVLSVTPTGDFKVDLLPRPIEKTPPPDKDNDASDEEA